MLHKQLWVWLRGCSYLPELGLTVGHFFVGAPAEVGAFTRPWLVDELAVGVALKGVGPDEEAEADLNGGAGVDLNGAGEDEDL